MGRERLEKNLADQMKEAQLKLGYEEETMRLYYPVASLNLLLGTDCEKAGEMKETLEKLLKLHYGSKGKKWQVWRRD